jgi:hypothetical protein
MEKLAPGGGYRRVNYADLTANCPINYDANTTNSRLDWSAATTAREHTTTIDQLPLRRRPRGMHKSVKDTLEPKFQWGEQFYSLAQRDGLQP